DIAVQQEIKKYGYNAALIPAGLLYICGKSLSDYPSSPASVKSLTTSCDRRVTRPLRIYGVAGHMHIRGYDIRIELNDQTLLHIPRWNRSEEHTSELQSPYDLVCRLLLEKKKQLPHSWRSLTMLTVLILMPVGLVAIQPDLGTAALIAVAGILVIVVEGLRVYLIVVLVVL